MLFSIIIIINEDIIQINNNKNIELLVKKLVNVSLEACQGIYQSEKNYLILEVVRPSLKYCFLFIFFANTHSMVHIYKVELGKPLSPV